MPRWLLALLIVSGLFAMHGITAATASASVPCGVAAPHDHQAAAPAADPQPTLAAAGLAGGHEGAVCLAVLVGGLLLGLLARHRAGRTTATPPGHAPLALTATGRAPPLPLRTLLCVSRT